MRAFWTDLAQRDLAAIGQRIAEEDEAGALQVVRALLDVVAKLTGASQAGTAGRVPETRELDLGGGAYRLVFAVDGDRVDVLRILHLV